MSRLQRLCLGAGLLLALTQCQTAEPIPEIAGYYERSCWFSGSEAGRARCGWLVVPENRSRAGSRMISLPVVIFPAREEGATTDPILYIAGGPGARVRIGERWEIAGWQRRLERFPPDHDVVALGLRGTGRYEPDFGCPKLNDPRIWAGAGANPPPLEERRKTDIEETQVCRERLLAEGVDLTAYNSRETAADIVDLKRGLGIENWNLYGVSYGARIALTVLRHDPQGVRSVVLDSAFPPEAPFSLDQARTLEAILKRLYEDCDKSAHCRQNYPNLAAQFEALMDRLERDPVELSLRGGSFWLPMPLTLDDRKLLAIIFSSLSWWVDLEVLPRTIFEATAGEFESLKNLASHHIHRSNPDNSSMPVRLSFFCHEEVAFETARQRAAAIRDAGRLAPIIEDDWTHLTCEHWPAGKADPVENEPVASDVPALLLAGSYDTITPPILAQSAAEHLARSHVVEFPNVGHGVLSSHPCASELLIGFLANPTVKPEPPCLQDLAPPDFSEAKDDLRRKRNLR